MYGLMSGEDGGPGELWIVVDFLVKVKVRLGPTFIGIPISAMFLILSSI